MNQFMNFVKLKTIFWKINQEIYDFTPENQGLNHNFPTISRYPATKRQTTQYPQFDCLTSNGGRGGPDFWVKPSIYPETQQIFSQYKRRKWRIFS